MTRSVTRQFLVLGLATLLASGCGPGGAPAPPTISSHAEMHAAKR